MKKEKVKNTIISYVKKAIEKNKILYPTYGWIEEEIPSKIGTIKIESSVISDNDRWQQVWEVRAYACGVYVVGYYEYNEDAPDKYQFK